MSADTPTIQAEQALLGAILADEQARSADPVRAAGPRLLDEVVQWIQPGDFYRPYHRQVWGAMLAVRRRPELATPGAVLGELSRSPHLRAETAQDGLLLHQLMARTPVTSRAPMYAGMVVEASLHRDLYEEGIRLEQGSRSGDPAQVLAAQTHARTRLRALRRRWERTPPAVRVQLDRPASPDAAEPSPVELRAQARQLADHLQATRERVSQQRAAGQSGNPSDLSLIELLTEMLGRVLTVIDGLANASIDTHRSPTPTGRTALAPGQSLAGTWHAFVEADTEALARDDPENSPEEAERSSAERTAMEGQLIGSIIRDQRQLDELALTADQLTDPYARQMYQAAVDIHHGAGPVDELTIEWAVQRAGGDLSAARPELRNGIAAGTAGQAAAVAEQLRAAAARDRAARAAEAVRQTAADPRIPPARMLARAEAELADLPEPQIRHRQAPAPRRPEPQQAERQPEAQPAPRGAQHQPVDRQPRPQQRGHELSPRRRTARRRPLDREPELELCPLNPSVEPARSEPHVPRPHKRLQPPRHDLHRHRPDRAPVRPHRLCGHRQPLTAPSRRPTL